MASIRKRLLPSGKSVWQVDYRDGGEKRRHRQFATKREADAFCDRAKAEVANGVHVHASDARSVETAYALLLQTLENDGAARSTVEHYRTFWKSDVQPYWGATPLPKVHPADVGDWLQKLKEAGRTESTRRRARIVLGAIFDEAIRKRLTHVNPVRSLHSRRKTRRAEIREVEDTIVIPERDEVRALLDGAGRFESVWLIARPVGRASIVKRIPAEHPLKALALFKEAHRGAAVSLFRPVPWLRPFLATLALSGIRIGETRGIGWHRVSPGALQVRDAVDRFNVLGPVKTAAGIRDVPIGPQLERILVDWKRSTSAPHALVFPSETGSPLTYSNVANRHIGPLQIALGITAADGSPRYTPHAFRHFAVSLWIDEGASPKQVSEWAGHDDPAFTMRVYGHLFRKGRADRTAATAGERSVFGSGVDATDLQHATGSFRESRVAASS